MDHQQKILTEIVAAIANGVIDVDSDAAAHMQSCLDRVSSDDESGWTAFSEYLAANQLVARTVGSFLVREGYRFLDEELERLREIKSQRNFTDEERQYGIQTLTSLLDSITKLATKVGVPDP